MSPPHVECAQRLPARNRRAPRCLFLTALSSAAAETYDPAGQAQKVLHGIHRLCTACFKLCVVRRTAQASSQCPVGVLQIAVASGTSKQKNPAASARCANRCDRLHSSVSHGHCQFRRRSHRWSPRKGREKAIATTDGTTFADTRVVQDGYATFMIENDNAWIQMVEGSEIVKRQHRCPPVR